MFESLTIFDGILTLILLIGVIVGLRVGFIGFIAKPIKLIAAGALTVCVSPPILDAWTRPHITEKLSSIIYNNLIEKCPELTGETANSALPGFLKFLAGHSIPIHLVAASPSSLTTLAPQTGQFAGRW